MFRLLHNLLLMYPKIRNLLFKKQVLNVEDLLNGTHILNLMCNFMTLVKL